MLILLRPRLRASHPYRRPNYKSGSEEKITPMIQVPGFDDFVQGFTDWINKQSDNDHVYTQEDVRSELIADICPGYKVVDPET